MYDQMTLPDSSNTTSSPASASGAMQCDSPVGPTIGPYGPDRALASLSAKQVADWERRTNGTYGLCGATSFASAALQQSLVSRLRARLQCTGSPLFKLTWKAKVTPSHRLIYRLRASALRTPDSDCSSWPTAATRDWKSSASNMHGCNSRPLNEVARLATWPTTRTSDAEKAVRTLNGSLREIARKGSPQDLCQAAMLTVTGGGPTGSTAETKSTGQLNPAHSRWLMGLPPVWDVCGVTATQSLPRSRRNSSRRT